MNIEDLEARFHEAVAAKARLRNECLDYVRRMVDDAKRSAEESASVRWDAAIMEAEEARRQAEEAYQAALVAEALSAKRDVPIGTVLLEWDYRSPGAWRRTDHRELTGRKGVLELVTPASEVPERWRWRLPSVGGVIVRLLTKDGKPGKKFERYGVASGPVWLPEGQKP